METHNDLDDTTGGGSDVVDGYERLRANALCGDTEGWRLGLGVLQQRGLAAWLRVRQATVPAACPPARVTPLSAGGVDGQLVALLASMALAVAAQG